MPDVVIYSRFHRPITIPSPVGDGMQPVFEERIIDGKEELVLVDKQPINDLVQEALPDTLVYNILARYQRGDVDALSKVSGEFMDVTGMPTTLAEAQQQLINIERKFDALPLDVRKQFNNSVNEFIAVVSAGKLDDVLKVVINPEVEVQGNVEVSDIKDDKLSV